MKVFAFKESLYPKTLKFALLILFTSWGSTTLYAQHTESETKKLATVMSTINMLLLEGEADTLIRGETLLELVHKTRDSKRYAIENEFTLSFARSAVDSLELCFKVETNAAVRSGALTALVDGVSEVLVEGQNCFSFAQSTSGLPYTLVLTNGGTAELVISSIIVQPERRTVLALESLSNAEWNQEAVRKVLKVFAFGGHALTEQINTWADMSPEQAIQEMLNFDEHNLKLSPLLPADRFRDTQTQYGTLSDFARNYLASSSADTPIAPANRGQFTTYNMSGAFTRMATVRGLNPFRQRIALWETNYHLAVSLDSSVNPDQMMTFYDAVMEAHESGVSYEEVLATAAKSAATAVQYGHYNNVWLDGICFCNEDFAREIHQLYFGIFGNGDQDYHENTTIPNTAKMLTGMQVANSGTASEVTIDVATHHVDDLEILRQTISGADANEKIDALVKVSIKHPESLRNLPILIIEGLADDKLSDDDRSKLRAAWAALGDDKQFLSFIHAYATSRMFHDGSQLRYLTSVERLVYLSNKTNTENIEALLATQGGRGTPRLGRAIDPALGTESVFVFRPIHGVFGGQTGLDAADAPIVFERQYNLSTRRKNTYWDRNAGCENCTQGQSWFKDWSQLIPATDGQYPVSDVAEWLWVHVVGSTDNYSELERASLMSILADVDTSDRDAYVGDGFLDISLLLCVRQEAIDANESDTDTLADLFKHSRRYCRISFGGDEHSAAQKTMLSQSFSAQELENDAYIQSLLSQMATVTLPLESADAKHRLTANKRIQYALAFIHATPFVFVDHNTPGDAQ